MRKRHKKIGADIAALSTSLPLARDSAILAAVDDERMDVLRAVMLGPAGAHDSLV